MANECYQGQDTTIYLYICNKRRSYQLVKVIDNILEAANFLNTSCKFVERYLDSKKRFKENRYLVRSKPIKDGDDF